MKIDVENLISIIEENYPPIKKSGYWEDLIKLIPKDTPEFQWPTEVEFTKWLKSQEKLWQDQSLNGEAEQEDRYLAGHLAGVYIEVLQKIKSL